ncbi:MAG: MFS transporter [Candidatus Levyibacteriota bacterium]
MMEQRLFERTLGKTFLSLHNRNFRLFFFGQLISNTGNWLATVALILLVLKITGSGFAVGLLTACQFGPILFLSAWAGAIADRLDKRRLILLTQCLQMIQSIGLAILAFMPHPPLLGLYVLTTLGGILLAFDNPFRRAFVSEMVPAKEIPNAVVLYSAVVNVSRIFGPALAGLLVVTVGFGWCFTIDAVSYIAVLLGLLMMRPSELHRHLHRLPTKGGVGEGIRYIRSTPLLWISFVMLALIGTLSYNFNVTLPLFVTDTLHSTDVVFTILYSVFSLGAVVCALIVAHRSLVGMRHIIIGATVLGFAMVLLACVATVSSAMPVAFFLGMASILYMTSTTALAQVEAKHEMHGRVLALQTVLVGGTTLIGGPLSGWLADTFGGRAPLLVGGMVCIFTAAFGYWATKYYLPRAIEKTEVVTGSMETPDES